MLVRIDVFTTSFRKNAGYRHLKKGDNPRLSLILFGVFHVQHKVIEISNKFKVHNGDGRWLCNKLERANKPYQ